ncbi:hypothetical protein GSU68_12580 [Rathayibacter sp. VKM Ac-2759]|uniref:hypothetical protein n=1 Tax=Rathayibacter sp. VKM Ac-2759 TaxID=2609252 RepID=UPI001317A435|nr:hypothetical protein [Rathayibacter sp. VKM Ac-2759]QHC67316.1 hypothetical protein GSU68_12580 [Rathayibacter sp. VKM Ac-2759]
MRRSLAARAGVGALLLALTGCASGAPGDSVGHEAMSSAQVEALAAQERDAGHGEQAAFLEDGVVTFEEYDASFVLYARCLTDRGLTVEGPQISPVDGVRYQSTADIGTHERTAALADIDECEAVYRTSVAQAYELSQPQVMDAPLAEAAAECLRGKGLAVTGEETDVADFVDSVGESESEEAVDCVLSEATRLYPEMTSLSVGY